MWMEAIVLTLGKWDCETPGSLFTILLWHALNANALERDSHSSALIIKLNPAVPTGIGPAERNYFSY